MVDSVIQMFEIPSNHLGGGVQQAFGAPVRGLDWRNEFENNRH